ncbi:hypothetical protein PspLS_06945 [Pyricularia sp. CBS 133598]|nr:hypothetical protein PspLS_06945 [Pyricularia sp. CBS 133598]
MFKYIKSPKMSEYYHPLSDFVDVDPNQVIDMYNLPNHGTSSSTSNGQEQNVWSLDNTLWPTSLMGNLTSSSLNGAEHGLFDNSSSSSVPPMFTPTSDADLPLLTPSLTPDLAPSDEFVCPLTDPTEPTTGSPDGAPLVSSLGPPLVSPLGPPLPSASYQMPVMPTVPPPITTDCHRSGPHLAAFPYSTSILNMNASLTSPTSTAGFRSSPISNNFSYHSSSSGYQSAGSPGYQSSLDSYSTPLRKRGHQRNMSEASAVSAASIAHLDFDKLKRDTGISSDTVQAYITGPDPSTGKWTCTYPDCGKMFGRKENVKSHVQTHLNDRPYNCPNCNKCFVRSHDLKRHAKIHTLVKAYACPCGKEFSRQDALTRHRGRGMCIGGLPGVVRKQGKRGRPRKARPDLEERIDKAARTRQNDVVRLNQEVEGEEFNINDFVENPFTPTSPEEDMFAPDSQLDSDWLNHDLKRQSTGG